MNVKNACPYTPEDLKKAEAELKRWEDAWENYIR